METLASYTFAYSLDSVFWLEVTSHDLGDDQLILWDIEIIFFGIEYFLNQWVLEVSWWHLSVKSLVSSGKIIILGGLHDKALILLVPLSSLVIHESKALISFCKMFRSWVRTNFSRALNELGALFLRQE